MRQSDEPDSEPDYLLRLTRHWQGMFTISAKVFLYDNQRIDVSTLEDSNRPALLSTQQASLDNLFGHLI